MEPRACALAERKSTACGYSARCLRHPVRRRASSRTPGLSVGQRGLLPSFSIPTLRHFMKRQAWQDLRLRFVISHSLVAGQLYSMFPVTRHRQGCQVASRTLIPPPAKGLHCPSPRGSHRAVVPRAGCSEVFVNTFPGLISTDIPGHKVWVDQGATALRNGRPQLAATTGLGHQNSLSWHFIPGRKHTLC